MRLTLDGRVLTVKIVTPQARRGTVRALLGRRIDAICAPDLRRGLSGGVTATRRWPRGRLSVRFRFARDISSRAAWCLLERDAGDVALVGFGVRDPRQEIASGISPGGRAWRLEVWSGRLGEPCFQMTQVNADRRYRDRHCFEGLFYGLRMGISLQVPCSGDSFLFGVVRPQVTTVNVRRADGSGAVARLYDSPPGSSLPERWFVAALPGPVAVRSVAALDANGRLIARRAFATARCPWEYIDL